MAMHDEQDMRNMGGIYKLLPITWILMIIGTLALTGVGIPILLGGLGFSGFFSKDMIMEEAFAMGQEGLTFGMFAFWIGIAAAALTSFYSWRLIFMTFHGKHRGDPETLKHAHESGPIMLIPLVLLAVGALFAGGVFKSDFVAKGAQTFWGESLPAGAYSDYKYGDYASGGDYGAEAADPAGEAHGAEAGYGDDAYGDEHSPRHPNWVLILPVGVSALGFILAWYFYIANPHLPGRIAAKRGPVHQLPAQQVVFRRAVRLRSSCAGPRAWRLLLEGGRSAHHRRVRAQRHFRRASWPRAPYRRSCSPVSSITTHLPC
jgi:NADH-quinone oxidoreductase subunit L